MPILRTILWLLAWLKVFSTLAEYIVYNYYMVAPRKIDSVQVTSVGKARLTMGHKK